MRKFTDEEREAALDAEFGEPPPDPQDMLSEIEGHVSRISDQLAGIESHLDRLVESTEKMPKIIIGGMGYSVVYLLIMLGFLLFGLRGCGVL